MKKNLGTFILASRCGVGAVLLALCAFTTVSRATVVIDNTGNTTGGYQLGYEQGQVFTMGTAGNISSLTVTLTGTGSREAYVFTTSGGAPASQLYDLGSVSASTPTITGLNDSLSAGGTYAIVLDATGSTTLGWGHTADGTFVTGNGSSLGGLYYNNASIWTLGVGDFQMNLQVVPEVPITGAVMGFGALAIALGHTLRRKARSAVSGIA